ncbi:hypothetical protein Nans01_25700 [Nocardiopsis ansamitocini]|uniref:HTH luxR-type domain-containing protein n=1 Tax=Nocardiopsis ansamitocini TaxID=1670832 RepID=A0A9W6P6Z9_9ACTN|nr:hypothetical protein Nans01_25700 [Nocardiopsis ansamitocini]
MEELRQHVCSTPIDVVAVGHLFECQDTVRAVDTIVAQAESPIRLVVLLDPAESLRGEGLRCEFATLPTDIRVEELSAAIRVLSAGYVIRLPGAGVSAAESGTRGGSFAKEIDAITRRESDVFSLLARGHSNAEISRLLSISENTVKSHVRSILAKLGLRNRAGAVVYAHENKIF